MSVVHVAGRVGIALVAVVVVAWYAIAAVAAAIGRRGRG